MRQQFRLDTAEGIGWLRSEIEAIKPALVSIDSLSRVHLLEENSRSEMAPMLNQLLKVADETRTAISLVHHHRKSSAKYGSSGGGDVRGSGDLAAVVRSILHVTRESDGLVNVRTEGNYCAADQFAVEMVLPGRDDPNGRAHGRIVHRGEGGSVDLQAQIVALLSGSPRTRDRLVEELRGAGKDRRREAVDTACANGVIVECDEDSTDTLGRKRSRRMLRLASNRGSDGADESG